MSIFGENLFRCKKPIEISHKSCTKSFLVYFTVPKYYMILDQGLRDTNKYPLV